MDVTAKHSFQDEWLAKALLYYQIIDQNLYAELSQRYSDEEYLFDVLVQNDYLSAADLAVFIENALKIPALDLENIHIEKEVIELVPEEFCRKYLLIPIKMSKKDISIACFNPSNLDSENELEHMTGRYVKTFFSFKEQIQQKISEYYSPDKIIDSLVDGDKIQNRIRIPGEEGRQESSPVVRLVNQIFANAIEKHASDIHIEPKEATIAVRLRVDGVLHNMMDVPRSIHSTLISRIKILSNLNIAETRKPQDGKAKIYLDDNDIDLRISILPTNFGEKVVIRILDKRNAMVSFEKMGIRGMNKNLLEECFNFKQGMVLVTGPTGSGKSTTLYSAINRIRSTTNNILTIEDPIEYMINGINQVQVNEKAGITFATALRSFLRQDPDVILVGEIRDRETAEIAIQAALTGHLVLSTLHTNDTFTTITRLRDMGIDPFKVSESVQAIIAQRLVRKLCPKCRVETPKEKIDDKLAYLLEQIGYQARLFEAKGCPHCGYEGYKGRIGVFEILILEQSLKEALANDVSISRMRAAARERGFRNLFEDALSLVAEGITDYREVLRIVNPDNSAQLKVAAGPAADAPKKATAFAATQPEPRPEEKSPQMATEGAAGPPKETAHHSGAADVLIVEDYKTTRLMLRKMIEKQENWTVREAEDGLQGLEAVRQKTPDIILLDLMMPNMDGYEFLQHIRSNLDTANIPVLIITSLQSVESEVKGFNLGADDFITKPIKMDLLIARMKRYLGRDHKPSPTNGTKPEAGKTQPAVTTPVGDAAFRLI